MDVAYLINQYPKVSHSFVRREIHALEEAGVRVHRFALRGWNEVLVDPADQAELPRTRHVLRDGALPLLRALAATALLSPIRFVQAARLAMALGGRSQRGRLRHLAYLAEACLLVRWLKAADVTHLHAHFGTNTTDVAMLCRRLGGPPYSFTVHGPEEFDQPLALSLGAKIRDSAFVVAISSFGRSQLFRWAALTDWHKVRVVHCGLDERFHEGAGSAPPDAPRLVCVGRLSEQKGHLLLLHAVARLRARGRALEVVLAGDGELRPVIEATCRELGLQDTVRITGWVGSERVREEILAARALVLPSFAEGLPVVLMEAMALSRPVITTSIAGIPELVHHREHGWLVPAGDVEQLAEAIAECLDAAGDDLARMGARARGRAIARHTSRVEGDKLLELFRSPPQPGSLLRA